MTDLTVVVISWKRPHLLRDTLNSIKGKLHGLSSRVVVVDNESSPETRAVIEAANVDYHFLETNTGQNYPLEHVVKLDSEFVCVSDHDLHYARPFALYVDFLKTHKDIEYSKGCDSLEHAAYDSREFCGEKWLLKRHERGGGVVLRTSKLKALFPLPKSHIDLDWHMGYHGGPFAVLPGTVAHTGYRESTWQPGEVAEPYLLVDGVIVSNRNN